MSEPGFLSEVWTWFTDPANWEGSFGIPVRAAEHLRISAIPLLIAAAIALPAGVAIGHFRRFEFAVVTIANLGRAIPSFGLLLIFVTLLGLGDAPITIALTLLAIPPIVTNTYVGVREVDPDTMEAARGMGMSELEVLREIELPLAAPLAVSGLRTAAVQVVATATLAAAAGGGGLGRIIVDAYAVRDFPQIFSGAVLVALLAIAVELLFAAIQRAVSPRMAVRLGRGSAAPAPVVGPAA
jgi:osmoprotectant transport system permease protein